MTTAKGPERTPWLDAETIKRSVPIETVLIRYGIRQDLRGAGVQLTGHSPFREGDSRPSFSVNLERGVWNDGAGRPVIDGREVPGNVIGLVMALDGCSFRDALLRLHRDYVATEPGQGVERPQAEQAQGAHQEPAGAVSRAEEGERAASLRHEAATAARDDENEPFGKELGGLRTDVPLMKEKGIDEATLKNWGVGYCSRGWGKGHIVFPIRNREGVVMSYAKRAPKEKPDDGKKKYEFFPGFHKGRELFGIERLVADPQAREAVAASGIVLVEGFCDVLRLWQNGVKNTVALMGTDFHEAQKAVLLDQAVNPTRRLTLFLDNDDAGRRASLDLELQLVNEAWIRIVDYGRVPKGAFREAPDEPEHFTAEELRMLLG